MGKRSLVPGRILPIPWRCRSLTITHIFPSTKEKSLARTGSRCPLRNNWSVHAKWA